MALPLFHLVRHGETTWALTGQHTGLTDIPLTPSGEQQAARLAARLSGIQFAAVFTSPLQRAAKTCELAGFGAVAQRDRDLVEWDYGEFEGKTTAEIRKTHPGWLLFRDGCPGGETLEQISARADRFIAKVRAVGGDCTRFLERPHQPRLVRPLAGSPRRRGPLLRGRDCKFAYPRL